MNNEPIIGREKELQQLISLLIKGANGEGNTMFIEGDPGIGKTKLLNALEIKMGSIPYLESMQCIYGYCNFNTGANSAFQPFIEVLNKLPMEGKWKGTTKKILEIIKETAPDWLEIFPVIGPAIKAGVKTSALIGQSLLNDDKNNQANISAIQYINALTKIASSERPLLLIIEDAHWIDDASCQLLLRLSEQVAKHPLITIVTYRPSFIHLQHPLYKVRQELTMKGVLETISLEGWNEDQLRIYVQNRFGSELHPQLSTWLCDLCNGNPLFINHYLSLLEQDHLIVSENGAYKLMGNLNKNYGEWELSNDRLKVNMPNSIQAVLGQRIERLAEAEQNMLCIGAVQGEHFQSLVLSELSKQQPLDVVSRLRKIKEQYHIISDDPVDSPADDWWKRRSQPFSFEHILMQQAFYDKLTPFERQQYHFDIGQFLEGIYNDLKKNLKKPARKLVLEIAFHYDYERGSNAFSAAQYYYVAAQASFQDGALKETTELCNRGRDNMHHLDEDIQINAIDRAQLSAELIQLLLVSSEMSWRGRKDLQSDLPLTDLVNEAEAAAEILKDHSILVKIKYIKGKLLRATEGLDASLITYQEALKIAQESNDTVWEFIILSDLGHRMASKDLAAGMKMMYQAEDIYNNKLIKEQTLSDSIDLKRYFFRLQATIGVNEFDQGNFDVAVERLVSSVEGLKNLRMFEDLLVVFSFLGQVYISMGLFEDAESVLLEAVNLIKDKADPRPFHAYDLSLLGKLYIEWGRISEAEKPIEDGWEETLATWNVDIAPMVANHRAEFLMNSDYTRQDLKEAERQLIEIIDETQRTGFIRSTIVALMLRSKLALMEGNKQESLNFSTQAVEHLRKLGMLVPAVRSEEVLLTHYEALQASALKDDSQNFLEEAYYIVQQKANTIKNLEHRRLFLEQVPLNRAILALVSNLKSLSTYSSIDL